MTDYVRVLLKGILTTQSELHIGTGDETDFENAYDETHSYNDICHDIDGRPYIPASTLRGYLRNIVEKHEDETIAEILFGTARQKTDSKDQGKAGLLRVYDARWQSAPNFKINESLKTKTSIEPLTATSKDFQLSTHALVPANSRFLVHIEMDKLDQAHVESVLKALNTLGEKYQGQIGKSKTDGMGKMQWQLSELKTLSEAQLKKWLRNDNDQINYQEKNELSKIIETYNNPQKRLTFNLNALSPLLMIDSDLGDLKRKQWKANGSKEEDKPYDHYFTKTANSAIIAGSSLKGWARARCRKILLTLITQDCPTKPEQEKADKLTDQLFGHTNQRGLISFHNAKSEFEDNDIHHQTFIAVDRFTGGVKDGALFNVEAIWPQNSFQGEISYDENKLQGWMKLLLLFVIRDAMQGDLVLGWGKSRGYGQLTASTEIHTDWQNFSKLLDDQTLAKWQEELNQQIQLHAQQEQAA